MSRKPLPYAWKHAKLAYKEPKVHIDKILSGSALAVHKTEKDFCYIAAYEYHIVISFRGTEANLKSWMSNLDPYPLDADKYTKEHLGGGIIHDGFYNSWVEFKPFINETMKQFKKTPRAKDIIVTGHSRGGALAELCARHLAKNRRTPCSCITFGCPAVGTKKYRDDFRKLPINGTRVVNGWDIVPRVPPRSIGFRQGCANLVYNKKSWWKRLIPGAGIKDHLVKRYNKFMNKRYK